mgnify:CR=1 FL=1
MATGESARVLRRQATAVCLVASILLAVGTASTEEKQTRDLVPVPVELPNRQFRGTPKDFRAPFTKPVQTEEGPPFLAPAGTTNVAMGKPVSGSDEMPVIGELEMVTDGDKEAADGSFVELGPFRQHVTIDLEAEHEIYGLRVWHYHQEARVYFDVVIQVSNDPNFATGVKTVFNNDRDNSSGLGIGRDMHYVETHFGEVVDARGVRGRYVRLYSRGNTADDLNHYIEVEVYGRPVSKGSDGGVDTRVRRAADGTRLVPLEINYPKPLFIGFGRWKDVPYREEFPVEPPAPLFVPEGTRNLALGKPVTSSEPDPIIGRLEMITDGEKDFRDGHYVELDHGGLQHITIDLQQSCEIHAVAVWHYYAAPRVYFDVILQISEGPMGTWTRKTLYNNDLDNSARLGIGTDRRYVETHFGKVILVKGVSGRYVRLYSNGSSMGELNQYVEVEVYGRPVEGR